MQCVPLPPSLLRSASPSPSLSSPSLSSFDRLVPPWAAFVRSVRRALSGSANGEAINSGPKSEILASKYNEDACCHARMYPFPTSASNGKKKLELITGLEDIVEDKVHDTINMSSRSVLNAAIHGCGAQSFRKKSPFKGNLDILPGQRNFTNDDNVSARAVAFGWIWVNKLSAFRHCRIPD